MQWTNWLIDWKLVSDNMWYVQSKLISEGGIKQDGNSGIPGKSILEFGKANGNCCNTLSEMAALQTVLVTNIRSVK